MKKRLSILAFCLFILICAAPASRTVRATFWVEDLSLCIDDFGTSWHTCWDVSYMDMSDCQNHVPPGEQREQCESVAQSNKLSCLSSSTQTFGSCSRNVNYDYAALDFCSNARVAHDSCLNQFQGVDNHEAYMECRNASGIDRCQ